MQKKSPASASCAFERNLAFVPFSWEEKPGVPKTQESHLFVGCVPLCKFPDAITPLRKPPRLQHDYGPLCKTPSFNSTIFSAPRSFSSRLLQVRRQSFDTSYGDDRPLTEDYSHESFIVHQSWTAQGQHGATTLIRMEDDPFFMAIQACRKEPIRVFYHHDRRSCARVNCEEEGKSFRGRSQEIEEGFKHLTIQQLFSQQSRAEEEHPQKAQTQPLNDEEKQANGLFTFVARCFGCY